MYIENTRFVSFDIIYKALRTLVDIARLVEIERILGECLLISNLPGKALRTLVDIARLSET